MLVKGLAVCTEAVVICLLIGLALLVFDPLVGLDLATRHIVGATGYLTALGLFHGWLALSIGAAIGSRALAIGVPAGLAAAGYVVNGLHSVAGWLNPFRFLSSFWLVGSSPLQGGSRLWGILVAGALLVERCDLEMP